MKNITALLLAIICLVATLCFASIVFAANEGISAVDGSSPVDTPMTVSEDYRIVEEDVLRIDVWGEPQMSNMQMQVTPDGKVNVPFLGMTEVSGLTISEFTDLIVKKLADEDILYNARVQITLLQMHQPTVRVLGEVNRPGQFAFKDGDTIFDAIAQAGSYTENAWLEKAKLSHQGSSKTIPVDLKKMFEGDLSQNYELQNGDTIYIPPEDYENKFYVLGQVMRPGIYDLKDKTTVLSAVTLAGGATERGALRSTVVVRGDPAKPERVPCDLTKLFDKADLSQDVELRPGDVVIVPESKKPNWSKISQILSVITSLSYVKRYGLF